jgi:hypothetical protein
MNPKQLRTLEQAPLYANARKNRRIPAGTIFTLFVPRKLIFAIEKKNRMCYNNKDMNDNCPRRIASGATKET